MNQSNFFNFLLHFLDVSVVNGFRTEIFLHLTIFAQRKYLLWKNGGLGFLKKHTD